MTTNREVLFLNQIQLVDNKVSNEKGSRQGGHAYRYLSQLLKIKGTVWKSAPMELCTFAPNPIKYVQQRIKYLNQYEVCNCIHFLQLDEFYKVPAIFKKLKNQGKYIIATMHHYPTSKVRGKLLKLSSKYIDVIVVHSTYIRNELEKMGVKSKIEVINYPVFDSEVAEKVSTIPTNKQDNKMVFLCLGDTRVDKGLNILIDAFPYLSEDIRKKCRFVVAGKESDISYATLLKASKRYGVEVQAEPGFVKNIRYWELIQQSDVVLLPYTRLFTGASGPLTDGVYKYKKIIGCDFGNIGDTIRNNELGNVFCVENPQSLAKEITAATTDKWTCSEKYINYRNTLNLEAFVDAYKRLYQGIN